MRIPAKFIGTLLLLGGIFSALVALMQWYPTVYRTESLLEAVADGVAYGSIGIASMAVGLFFVYKSPQKTWEFGEFFRLGWVGLMPIKYRNILYISFVTYALTLLFRFCMLIYLILTYVDVQWAG